MRAGGRGGAGGERVRREDRGCDEGRGIGRFFFFKQKTAYEIYQCDWSSDVCSSDLGVNADRDG